jgi:hypothetical protein
VVDGVAGAARKWRIEAPVVNAHHEATADIGVGIEIAA